MKVAYFIGALNQGGMESLTLDICTRHKDAGFDVVCLYRNDGNYSNKFQDAGVPLIKINFTNIVSYVWRLRKLILREKIDIVHAQTQSNALVCIMALLRTGIPIVTTLHGFSFSEANRLYRSVIYRFCKSILCVSEYQKKYYVDKWHLAPKNKLQVIYNGIDFSKFDIEYPIPDFLEKDNLAQLHDENCSAPIRLAMIGSFMSGRSQLFLLKSLHLLSQQTTIGFVFYFVGKRVESEPWRYDECVEYAEQNNLLDRVRFVGGRGDVPAILQHIDGFVYSTEHDTFGIAVVEALGAGVPVVANDWTVMKEITQNGKWGGLYKTNDYQGCVWAILELLQHIEQRKQEARQQAVAVREKYAIENHIKQLGELYESC